MLSLSHPRTSYLPRLSTLHSADAAVKAGRGDYGGLAPTDLACPSPCCDLSRELPRPTLLRNCLSRLCCEQKWMIFEVPKCIEPNFFRRSARSLLGEFTALSQTLQLVRTPGRVSASLETILVNAYGYNDWADGMQSKVNSTKNLITTGRNVDYHQHAALHTSTSISMFEAVFLRIAQL